MKRAARGNVGSCGIRGATDRKRDHFGPTRTIGMWISAQRFNYVSERFVLWNIGASTNIQQPLGRTDAQRLVKRMFRAADSERSSTARVNKSCCRIGVPRVVRIRQKCHAAERTRRAEQWRHGALTEEETGW